MKRLLLFFVFAFLWIVQTGTSSAGQESDMRVYAQSQDEFGRTPLFFAHNVEDVRRLTEYGADVNARDKGGRTAIFSARDVECIEELVKNGAEVNIQDNNGATPLMAMAYRDAALVAALLRLGADITILDNDGKNVLMYAAKGYGTATTAPFLLAAGVKVNDKDKNGWTALMHAAATGTSGSHDAMAVLLAAGAKLNAKNNEGQTPLDVAIREQHSENVKTLAQAGAKVHIDAEVYHEYTYLVSPMLRGETNARVRCSLPFFVSFFLAKKFTGSPMPPTEIVSEVNIVVRLVFLGLFLYGLWFVGKLVYRAKMRRVR